MVVKSQNIAEKRQREMFFFSFRKDNQYLINIVDPISIDREILYHMASMILFFQNSEILREEKVQSFR